MVQFESRKPKSQELDFIIFGDAMGEVGAAWNMTGETTGMTYISATFEHPNISARKVYTNLGQRKDVKDSSHVLIWNPRS